MSGYWLWLSTGPFSFLQGNPDNYIESETLALSLLNLAAVSHIVVSTHGFEAGFDSSWQLTLGIKTFLTPSFLMGSVQPLIPALPFYVQIRCKKSVNNGSSVN